MKRLLAVTALCAVAGVGSVYALSGASTIGTLSVSTTSWLAATVAGAGDGNPQAPFSYTLNPGNGRRAFAFVKNFGPTDLSSVTLTVSGGQTNRTVTVTACSGAWDAAGNCSGSSTTVVQGSAANASGTLGPLPVGGVVAVRISCPQNVSGQITTAVR